MRAALGTEPGGAHTSRGVGDCPRVSPRSGDTTAGPLCVPKGVGLSPRVWNCPQGCGIVPKEEGVSPGLWDCPHSAEMSLSQGPRHRPSSVTLSPSPATIPVSQSLSLVPGRVPSSRSPPHATSPGLALSPACGVTPKPRTQPTDCHSCGTPDPAPRLAVSPNSRCCPQPGAGRQRGAAG